MADFINLGSLVGLQGLQSSLAGAADRFEASEGEAAMHRALAAIEPHLVRSIMDRTKTRSGMLRRTRSLVEKGPRGRIGPTAIYGAAQEVGGEIKAKRARNLAIPLPPAQTAAGISRGGPRAYHDLFVITGRSGKKVLVRDIGGRLQAMFVLQRSVRLRAKRFLKPAAQKSAQAVADILGDGFVLGIKRGGAVPSSGGE